ncbi:LPP20 family lipoprotein [Alteromonas lipolytica]|uniref:Lipoprotein LPP20-like domain-containing protein n=1 Tax=Alteromonas lipolytica TaxID=1856405 RepID=A0A1E8FAK4_9ALTE|nr:LPP20 family lipoprotein [Alteromonas lipolytica]OFI32945.1 hypothetical protein BFC17_01320 [Alteromonas lipolytica]GGF64020.1 hypothetical protein GCM10011338_15440 [Alteromonas lipolytica]
MIWTTKDVQQLWSGYLALTCVLIVLSTSAHAQMPGWVQKSTQDTDAHMYGIGSGNSLEQAKNMALAELAGKVNSQVQQLFQMQEQAVNDDYSSEMSLDTRVEVGATDLKYFYVNQTEQSGSVYWVELVLDKTKMANDLKAQFEVEHGTLTSQMQALLNQSAFMQFLQANEAATSITRLKRLIMQVKYYSPAFSTSQYVQQYNQYLKQLQQATAANQVFLNDQQADTLVAKEFRNWLSKQGVNLAPSKSAKTDVIELTTTVDAYQDKRDAYIAELQTTVNVSSTAFGEIGHATFQTKGRDYKRESQALDKAVKAFKLKIQRKDPAKLLNIKVY